MRVLIIEDEFAAQANLRTLLKTRFTDIEVVGVSDSVSESVKWLQQNDADVIFMDVELADGTCFEIFQQIDITAKVVITTAYDNYAIRAFRVNSVDYLLKPIDPLLLDEAVQKLRNAMHEQPQVNNAQLFRPFYADSQSSKPKQRFVVRVGDKISIVKVEDIAYFFSKDKTSYLVTMEGKQYIVDHSLDMIETQLDSSTFFRASRACITNINAIRVVNRHFSGRLKLQLEPPRDEDLYVSRVRVNEFMHWLNQ